MLTVPTLPRMKDLIFGNKNIEMLNLIQIILICGFSWILHIQSVAQTNTDAQLNPSLSFQETIYLHINTSQVFAGETIYFKAYCMDYLNLEFSDLSKVAYVELINKDHQAVLRTKISLEGGQGHGEFFVPSGIETGVYQLIAYTKWMQNFGLESFFKLKW